MLVPGFSVDGVAPAMSVGRLAPPADIVVQPSIDAAVDAALVKAGIVTESVELKGWDVAARGFAIVIGYEAWRSSGHLLSIPGGVHPYVGERLAACENIDDATYAAGQAAQAEWTAEVLALLGRVGVLALPTLSDPPVLIADDVMMPNGLCYPFNVSGTPAISIPVGPNAGESLQLVAAPGGEELLLATAAVIERALA
jgi:amidase